MSLCIVAACQERGRARVVFSHDWKITEGDASSENTDKLAFIKNGWPAVFAGVVPFMDLMDEIFWDHVAGIEISSDNLEPELQAARGKFKRALIDRDLQGRFGMGYQEFMTKGIKCFRPDEHRQIVDQMQIELSQAEMLVGGIMDNDSYLYQVGELYAVPLDHFGTIGTGSDLASRWLHWRDQNEGLSLKQTLLNVYEAQRFGSMENSVGQIASLYVLNERGELRQIRPSFKAKLEKQYQAVKRQVGISIDAKCFYAGVVEPAGDSKAIKSAISHSRSVTPAAIAGVTRNV